MRYPGVTAPPRSESREKEQMTMTTVEEFLKANEAYAAGFQKGHLPMPPASE
jgi:hypothetical protein